MKPSPRWEESVPAGTKTARFLDVPGTAVRMPMTVVRGPNDGPRVLITGGVHGGEYPGIEAAIRLGRELDPSEVSGMVVLIHPVSPGAFQARRQYVVPQDGKNLNRQFPGSATGTVSERMAHALMTRVVGGMDAWIDLHGGDIHEALVPFTIFARDGDPEVAQASRAMAEVFGIELLIPGASLEGTTYRAAAEAGVPCILAEAGQLGRLDEASVRIHEGGCRNVLRHLGCLTGEVEPVAPVRVLKEFLWRTARHSGCWYPAVELGETVEKGQPIGTVRDYFGEILDEQHAPATGIVLSSVTSMAINAGDPLLAIGTG